MPARRLLGAAEITPSKPVSTPPSPTSAKAGPSRATPQGRSHSPSSVPRSQRKAHTPTSYTSTPVPGPWTFITSPAGPSKPSPPPLHPRHTPHHKTADELAAEEAAKLLHSPLAGSAISMLIDGGKATRSADALSPRSLRHRHLVEARERQEDGRTDEIQSKEDEEVYDWAKGRGAGRRKEAVDDNPEARIGMDVSGQGSTANGGKVRETDVVLENADGAGHDGHEEDEYGVDQANEPPSKLLQDEGTLTSAGLSTGEPVHFAEARLSEADCHSLEGEKLVANGSKALSVDPEAERSIAGRDAKETTSEQGENGDRYEEDDENEDEDNNDDENEEDEDDENEMEGDDDNELGHEGKPARQDRGADRSASAHALASLPADDDASDGASDSSGSEADDSSDSTSDDSSDATSSSEESDTSADEDSRLEAMLARAKLAAKAESEKNSCQTAAPGEGEDLLRLDLDERKEAPIPDLSIPNLPTPLLAFSADGTARALAPIPAIAGPSRSRPGASSKKVDEHGLELDDRPYERKLTKKEKSAQPRKATPSELWATLPTAKCDLLPQMKRDYQALALANSLDPKRFMKGGTKLNKVPESFAIGSLIEPPRRMQDTTLQRDPRYRPGQIVQGIVADQGTGEYAKRKYGDLQWNRMENGRGKGWKKRTKW